MFGNLRGVSLTNGHRAWVAAAANVRNGSKADTGLMSAMGGKRTFDVGYLRDAVYVSSAGHYGHALAHRLEEQGHANPW